MRPTIKAHPRTRTSRKPLLLHRIILERLSVGGENLKVVEPVFPPTVCPHHLLFSGHLGEFHAIATSVITGDHRISVWKALHTAGIIEKLFAEVLVIYFSDYLPLTINLNHPVAICTANKGIPISQTNRGKRPVPLFPATIIRRKGL